MQGGLSPREIIKPLKIALKLYAIVQILFDFVNIVFDYLNIYGIAILLKNK